MAFDNSDDDEDLFACFDDSDNDLHDKEEKNADRSPLVKSKVVENDNVVTKDADCSSAAAIKTSITIGSVGKNNREQPEVEHHQQRDPNCGVLSFHVNTERSLITHVRNEMLSNKKKIFDVYHNDDDETAAGGDATITCTVTRADFILNVIDSFCNTRHWMMHVGPDKSTIIKEFLDECLNGAIKKQAIASSDSSSTNRKSRRKQPFMCVELGTYCGYSAIMLANHILKNIGSSKLLDFHLFTLEADENHYNIAIEMIELAKLEKYITVIKVDPINGTIMSSLDGAVKDHDKRELERLCDHKAGGADTLSPAFSTRKIDFLLIDHDKDMYLNDLKQLERSANHFIRKGTFVVADNVVFAQIDEYRTYVNELASTKHPVVKTKLIETTIEYCGNDANMGEERDEQRKDNDNSEDVVFRDGIECTIYLSDPKLIEQEEKELKSFHLQTEDTNRDKLLH